MIPTIQQHPKGLHRRYTVTKNNGELDDDRAAYFVLRLDNFGRDKVHIKACQLAALAYAEAVKGTHLNQVAEDLKVLVEFNKLD